MPSRQARDSGAVHSHPTALLIIDMINTFDFPGSEGLVRAALPAAKKIAALKGRLKKRGVPVIYVNNNLGQWRSDWKEQFRKCAAPASKGKTVAAILRPEPDDYFVLKPKNSAFYCTSLEILLEELGTKELIITGVAANICVYFTVQDACARNYSVKLARDCVASNTPQDTRTALDQAHKSCGIRSVGSSSIR